MIASLVTRGDVDLEPIMEAILGYDVRVWNNATSPIDLQVLGRYMVSCDPLFPNTPVYVQDDDCLVDVGMLYRTYDYGTILCNLPATHRPNYINTPEKLVGFGAIFPYSLIGPTFALYLKYHPFDNVLLREADRIFTGLNWERIILADVPVTHLPHAESVGRMYRQPDHEAYRVEARRRVLQVLESEGRAYHP